MKLMMLDDVDGVMEDGYILLIVEIPFQSLEAKIKKQKKIIFLKSSFN